MLASLTVRNFVLIDQLALRFEPGFCLLTGETGAGKSILIDALSAALGGRVALDLIRHGEERALVEATFVRKPGQAWPAGLLQLLEAEGIVPEIEDELTLSRELTPRGSRCRLDGHQVPQATLRRAGRLLGDVVSQHEHQRLMDPAFHLELVDRYGRHEGLRASAEQAWSELSGARQALARLAEEGRDRARQEDFWRFQLAEIEAANLDDPGELEHLEAERLRLVHAQGLRDACREAYASLYAGERTPSAYDLLTRAFRQLDTLRAYDTVLNEAATEISGMQSALKDVSTALRQHLDRLDEDPTRLEAVEQRLSTLLALTRKYGPDLAAVLAHGQGLRSQLASLQAGEERREALEADVTRARAALEAACDGLTQARRATAARLEQAVERELQDLELGNTRFVVALRPHEAAPALRATGREAVEFQVATNPGEPARPLARAASGGEMARVMLALEAVLADLDAVQTLVFDEVDTGISGRAAQAVAEKLARLARTHQVLCITHLPAVAAMADQHTHLEKFVEGDRTRVEAAILDRAARVRELALLASGRAAPAALRHAEDLLARAAEHKGLATPPLTAPAGRKRR